ncbi:uncharacterized protein MONBRDRAFT_34360 [Monosiga brevicollis MX1]|uniref:Sialidase domain-containing protein n=1 Tax=Monosiga brevicollis TaxID=81824 RepID=A9VB55_MONBE|nr:uncharacterized protein MONBRDRAFT_34360 [Monosiga brevicollis MX1]EDQ85332.1 predicted protein [Monosiga brevicollis MX1]|eukprot:XP_001749953.1 hypothetical protein [Monosiga brevicollis MX1]
MAVVVAVLLVLVASVLGLPSSHSNWQSLVNKTDLFVNNQPYGITYPCYRQPALILMGEGLLAFAEGRNISSCAPPLQAAAPSPVEEVGGLVLRRSTDLGRTWSAPITLYSGNIDFYVTVYDAEKDVGWLFLQEESAVRVFNTTDQGYTWAGPFAFTAPVPPGLRPTVQPAVGHGLQLQRHLCAAPGGCAEAGTLVVPFVCMSDTATPVERVHSDTACASCQSCLLLSSDHGASWRFAALGQLGSREAQAVQIASNTSSAWLYVTERNLGPMPGHRMYAISHDAGHSYTETGINKGLVTPITADWTGTVASVESSFNQQPSSPLFMALPFNATVRCNLTLMTSLDAGATWAAQTVFWPGLGAYTDLSALPTGLGVIFENGEATFADRISFANLLQ